MSQELGTTDGKAKRSQTRKEQSARFCFMVTNYVQKVVGLLPSVRDDQLKVMGEDWAEQVRSQLGVEPRLIQSVFDACKNFMTPDDAIRLIIRGFGLEPSEECF